MGLGIPFVLAGILAHRDPSPFIGVLRGGERQAKLPIGGCLEPVHRTLEKVQIRLKGRIRVAGSRCAPVREFDKKHKHVLGSMGGGDNVAILPLERNLLLVPVGGQVGKAIQACLASDRVVMGRCRAARAPAFIRPLAGADDMAVDRGFPRPLDLYGPRGPERAERPGSNGGALGAYASERVGTDHDQQRALGRLNLGNLGRRNHRAVRFRDDDLGSSDPGQRHIRLHNYPGQAVKPGVAQGYHGCGLRPQSHG